MTGLISILLQRKEQACESGGQGGGEEQDGGGGKDTSGQAGIHLSLFLFFIWFLF